jgi:hypothetical protein
MLNLSQYYDDSHEDTVHARAGDGNVILFISVVIFSIANMVLK